MKNNRRARAREIEKSAGERGTRGGQQNGRTCDSMRFTAALRRFIAPSKHKMPGKRACAWVHPHFTFTADCRLNRATFSRFLAPENVPVRPHLRFSLAPPTPPSSPLGYPYPNAVTGSLLARFFLVFPPNSRPS